MSAGCVMAERGRMRFDCGAVTLTVSTRQRIPEWLGGEEYVYVTATRAGETGVRAEIDNNGRWLDRLSASVSKAGSWVRLHLTDPRGAAAGRYRYSNVAFVDTRSGTVIRTALAHSSDEERAAWFVSSDTRAAEQSIRGEQVAWQPCTVR